MNEKQKYKIDKKKLQEHLPKLLNSGLFLIDANQKPIGLFKLKNNKNKELCIRKSSIVPNLPELNLRIMVRKLNRTIFCYKNNIPHSPYIAFDWDGDDLVNEFEFGFKKYLEDQMFQLDELQPHLNKLLKKAKRILKSNYEKDWYPNRKELTEKQEWFYNLISPLYGYFNKYLTDRSTRKCRVSKTDIFHYISHLLIACGLEKNDPQRSHMPVFEKIKQYNHRHENYLK
jgi:hypothetical protein